MATSDSKTDNTAGGRWIPLESNPDVFNEWATKAGVLTSKARFVDVYGLDDELLSIVPRPVKALLLLFPIGAEGEVKRRADDERIAKEGQPKLDETIFFVKQTISNACGTIGLIHALANSDVTYKLESALHTFIDQGQEKTPAERAELLATTPLFASIHASTATSKLSSTVPKEKDMKTDLHFTCFVQAPENEFRERAEGKDVDATTEGKVADEQSTGMRLIELDGRRNGPVDHGPCKDLLTDAVNIVKANYISGSSSLEFNLMALSGGEPI